MGINYQYTPGQTPIDEDEKEGLLIRSISTLGELNEAEQLNIQTAVEWTLRRRFEARDIFSETFVRELHKRMYRDVWRWAGEFRQTDKNIGVDKFDIPIHLKQLLDDAQFWLANNTYPPDETAIRIKHRIVSIHCFANGNGRHSRLIADVISSHIFGAKVFSWSARELAAKSEARSRYLQSLKQADLGDMTALLAFARS
jgi:Fic-DOC domain mobile mystery protein B